MGARFKSTFGNKHRLATTTGLAATIWMGRTLKLSTRHLAGELVRFRMTANPFTRAVQAHSAAFKAEK